MQNLPQDPQIISLKKLIKPGTKLGTTIVMIFVLFYLIWGGFAPLDSAVIASGSVIPSKHRQLVQHLQGGTIDNILVQEGEIVKKGDVLYQLSKVQAKTKLQAGLNQYYSKKIAEIRIIAEQNNENQLNIPADIALKDADQDLINKITQSEIKLLKFNLESWINQKELLHQQIAITRQQLEGLKIQQESIAEQKKLVAEEVASAEELYKKDLLAKTQLIALQKAQAQMNSKTAEIANHINSTEETINQTQLKITQLEHNRNRELMAELKQVQNEISILEEQITSAQDVESRTEITAPVDGIVTNMRYFSINGVINPGATVLEIVPIDNNLIIAAKLSPQHIDVVDIGQDAKIMFTAFKARFSPRIKGKVTYISADTNVDEHSGQPYYLMNIKIDREDSKKLGKPILPGMMAQAFIVTGERTFLEYFVSPITQTFQKSFKEQ